MRKYVGIILLLIMAVGCSSGNAELNLIQGHDESHQSEPQQDVPEPQQSVPEVSPPSQPQLTAISQNGDQSIVIYADTNVSTDMLEGLTLKIGDKEKKLDWVNVVSPSFYPEIVVENLEDDSDDEIIIVLTKGHGTGVRDSEAHVLKRDFSEYEIEEPIDGIKSLVQSSLIKGDEVRTYVITVDGNTFEKEYPESDVPEGHWFDDVFFGNIVRYRVEDKRLIAELPAQVSPGHFIGTVEAKYSLMDNEMKIASVSFISDPS